MVKKKDNNHTPEKKSSADYYKLKTDAVDRLVNAEKKTYDKTKGDPGKEYRSKSFLNKIPSWIKALFIKFWFNAAVCFFIYWGLTMFIPAFWDMMLVLGVVLGVANDLLTNNVLHFFATTPGSNNKWMMFTKKKHWTLFANIPYFCVVLAGVIGIYSILFKIGGIQVEPILFGICTTAIDMLFIGIKNLFIKIINDAKDKANK